VAPEDRELLLKGLVLLDICDGLALQVEFFGAYRPDQPILCPPRQMRAQNNARNQLEELKAKYKWKSRGMLPSVAYMARASGLSALYKYLYAATSKWVHFNPGILSRMGWGPESSTGAPFRFSTKNFSLYYIEFNRFYGALLLTEFVDKLHNALNLPPEVDAYIHELRIYTEEYVRWPEVVTYEEMNVRPPSQLNRLLSSSAYRLAQNRAADPD
jgi:uncharacterized protein DUF5677